MINSSPQILVVSEDTSFASSAARGLRRAGYTPILTRRGDEALQILQERPVHAVVLDYDLSDRNGLSVLEAIQRLSNKPPVIMTAGSDASEVAIRSVAGGAFDFLYRPFDWTALLQIVERATHSFSCPFADVPAPSVVTSDFVGRSPAMRDVFKQIGLLARKPVPVLITGATGVGKEKVAEALVRYGDRAQQPFIRINCAAIPRDLIESELFGHERGAFTGAEARRIGKFEEAAGGTLFLDEVGELPVNVQAKLLRVLQKQEITRVGGRDVIRPDARIIVATNQNLSAAIQSGRFREDLFFRLSVGVIHLPSLAERPEDIPDLIHHFLRLYALELVGHPVRITPAAIAQLTAHPWPGNVRELENFVRKALIACAGTDITEHDLAHLLSHRGTLRVPPVGLGVAVKAILDNTQGECYSAVHDAVDRHLLAEVLQRVKSNKVAAARLLGISRTTLRERLRALGLSHDE